MKTGHFLLGCSLSVLLIFLCVGAPTFAQDSRCDLFTKEAQLLIDHAKPPKTGAQIQSMLKLAQLYTQQCVPADIDDTDWKTLITYDAASGEPLQYFSAQYLGSIDPQSQTWKLVGTGDEAFVQGTASEKGDHLYAVRTSPPYLLTYDYEGQSYPIYQVPVEGTTRLFILVKKGRAQSQFLDPSQPDDGILAWAGNWRTLQPAVNALAGVEIMLRVRLDAADSFLRVGFIGLPTGNPPPTRLLEIHPATVSIIQRDATDTPDQMLSSADMTTSIEGEWHTVKWIVRPYDLHAYLDDSEITSTDFDKADTLFAPLSIYIETSSPATISMDDIAVRISQP